MKRKGRILGILAVLLLVVGLFPITPLYAASTKGLTDYILLEEPDKVADSDGLHMALTVQEVKKPIYLTASYGGELYGYYFDGSGYYLYRYTDTVHFDVIDLGAEQNADKLTGDVLKKSGASLISSAGALILPHTGDKKPIDKFYVYAEDGTFLGKYTYEEFADSAYSKDESYSDNCFHGKGIVKIDDVQYDPNGSSVRVTVSWDFTKTQDIEERFVSLSTMTDTKDGQDTIDGQQCTYQLPRETEIGTEAYERRSIKDSTVLRLSASGTLRINLISSSYTYVLEQKLDLETAGGVSTPKPSQPPLPTPYVDEAENGKLKVTFGEMPKKVLTGTPVNIKMMTSIKAIKTFGGLLDPDLSNKSNFMVTENGTYEYRAESQNGQVVTGKLKVTCFVADTADLGLGDYFSDPNAPADGILPQTGGTPWYLYMFIGGGFALVGIVMFVVSRRAKSTNRKGESEE